MTQVTKRCLVDHLQFCERKSRRTAMQYPWEFGFLGKDHGVHFTPFPKVGPIGFEPLVPQQFVTDDDEDEPQFVEKHCSTLLCRQPQVSWSSKQDANREAALVKWQRIIMAHPMSFEVARAFFNSLKLGVHTGRLLDDLRNVFATKSSATLHSRAGPILRYLKFCGVKQLQPFPVLEENIYSYMQYEEKNAAPTYLRSFLSSVGFSVHVLGLVSAKHVIDSGRIKGLAAKCFLQKRKTEPRLPLTVSELQTLEDVVLGHRNKSIVDRHVAGCFLFMVFARARFSDMMNVGKLSFEIVKEGSDYKGYIETEVARSKTSFSMDRKVRLLPMTATIQGVGLEPWGVAWQKVVETSGIEVGPGKPLLPGRTKDGWHSLPLSAEAGTSWLRVLLQNHESFDKTRLHRIGTHSCKTTVLSWLSKWGADPQTRRLMGYHVADKMSTMLIYGRDNTSAGLRIIDDIIDAIRTSSFVPDAARVAMFPNRDLAQEDAELVEFPDQDDEIVSSSEDSADESCPDHDANEEAQEVVVGRWDGEVDVTKLPSDAVYFRHILSRTIHVTEDETGVRFLCGRKIEKGYLQLPTRPLTLIPICRQCFSRFKKE